MALTSSEVKSLKCPQDKKQIKKSDGNGLFLLIKDSGSKLWRFRYKYAGKHQEMALGKYPLINLADARESTCEARKLLAQGINPMSKRKENKRSTNPRDRAFSVVAMNWWEQQKESWSTDSAKRVKRWITEDTRDIADMDIDNIDAGHITDLMLCIEAKGTPKKAPNVLSVINRVYGYALAHRLTRTNPAQGLPLKDILKPFIRTKHRAAIITPDDLTSLIYDIDNGCSGSFCTVEALKLIPRLFLRPKEIRYLRWEFIDFKEEVIRIPAEDMKRGREHLVPMAKQVIKQLQYIKSITGYSRFVFPNDRDGSKPLSKNVLTNRLRSLGYSADMMSAHGFRSTASTLLHEQGWNHDVIETQLAHLVGSATSRAYNRSLHFSERKKMMQNWADYLDKIKECKHQYKND